jgi:ATP-binding cassette subfamily B protein
LREGGHTGRDAKGQRGWLRRLIGACRRYPRNLGLAVAGTLVVSGVGVAVPLIQRSIVDGLLSPAHPVIWPLAVALLAAAGANFGGLYVRRFRGGRLSLDVQHDLRTALFAAVSRLDGARQDALNTGQLVSRSISDLTMVQSLLAIVPMLMGNVVLFAGSLVAMLFLSPPLTLIALAVAPALWGLSLISRRTLFPASWDAQQQAAAVAEVVDAAVTGVRVVKAFGQEDQEVHRLERAATRLFASRMRTVRLTARYNPALQAVPALGQVGVLALGGWLALNSAISLGTFLAFSSYLVALIGPVRSLAAFVTLGQEARASVIRVFEVIDSRPVITDRPGARDLAPETPSVELDHVRFGYLESQPVLRGLSLTVAPGETVALVGTAGSGKSTISLLLPRFYDVSAGALRVGGLDVRDLRTDSLRAAIGLVTEESFLFSDTIAANIAFGREDATPDQITAAARAAGAAEFIDRLPEGYQTVVGEQGLTLSGGQRQRVALARALLTNPRILVLDDATSAVDPRIETEIHRTLREVMRGRTTLLIAHRRSTLRLADRIAVLDQGTLADEGTHEELWARSSLYRQLLGGPGDDAEGAGTAAAVNGAAIPLDGHGAATPLDGHAAPPHEGAPAAFAAGSPAVSPGTPGVPATPGMGGSRGLGRRGAGGGGGLLAGVPASPELLARVAALPPADDTPAIDQTSARAPDPRFTLRRLLRPFLAALVIGLVLDGLDALAGLAMPAIVRGGIDSGVEARDLRIVLGLSAVAAVIVGVDWLINVVQMRVLGRTSERLLYTLRIKIFAHLQRLGLDYYEHELAGRIMTRMTTDVEALSSFLQTGLITMVNSLLTFAGVLIALLVINLTLGLTVLAIIPAAAVATVFFQSRSSKAYRDAREKVSAVNADLQENVAGLRISQAFRREGRNAERFAGRSDAYRRSRLRAQRYIALYFPFVQSLSTIAGALVLLVAGGQLRSGALTAGALIAYLLYIDMLFSPVQQLSQVFDGYQQAAVGLRRIGDLLRTPTSTPVADQPKPAGSGPARIEFSGVHFSYGPGEPEALTGIDLVVEAGETVALVGQTGAGKSTLVKLVARFYDATAGRILVDGTDIRDLDLTSYRHRLGVVPQESHVFAGSLRDAIAYGRPDATDAEVAAAARDVGAMDMLARLPGGLDYVVSERGRNLSAGQRQLIALARAYLVHPGILLLDEATAALDQVSEAAVARATGRLMAERTTLVVAHRLTTAARADRIVVMDHGRIAEVGTHEDLVTAGGLYASLWAASMADPSLAA